MTSQHNKGVEAPHEGWEVDSVTVRYGDVVALREASLRIERGDFVMILGPSGSGKSTLLRVIAGLVEPGEGRVFINGADAESVPPHQRGVGLMFQQHALFPHQDVAQNVGFGLRMAGLSAADRKQKVRKLLSLVGLSGYETRQVTTLSGGQAQRVALARSLAPAPALLLLDEPFGSLDRVLRDHLADELPQILAETNTTAVGVTHDRDEALALASQLVVMDDGKILRHGPPARLWADPQSATVATFLGHRNIVTLEGRTQVIRSDAATIVPPLQNRQAPAETGTIKDTRESQHNTSCWGDDDPAEKGTVNDARGVATTRETPSATPLNEKGANKHAKGGFEGEIEGTVERVRFRGERYAVTVATSLGPLEFLVAQAPEVGDLVRLKVDPRKIVEISPSPPQPMTLGVFATQTSSENP